MTEKKRRGRPATGTDPMMGLRMSKQQRALALLAAKNAGKRPTVAAGVHALLAQYAASLAAKT